MLFCFRSFLTVMFLGVQSLAIPCALAQDMGVGTVTNFPLPRFVSLKSDRVNLREGPSKDHRSKWVFQRAGLPVEVMAEFETWRRIRDSEGADGWVLHSLLSGRRTALVSPWEKKPTETSGAILYRRADEKADVLAKLEPNVIVGVKSCTGTWCEVVVASPVSSDMKGYMIQEKLWGVYPKERIE